MARLPSVWIDHNRNGNRRLVSRVFKVDGTKRTNGDTVMKWLVNALKYIARNPWVLMLTEQVVTRVVKLIKKKK